MLFVMIPFAFAWANEKVHNDHVRHDQMQNDGAKASKKCKPCAEMKEFNKSFLDRLKKLKIPETNRLSPILIGNENAPHELYIYFSFTCFHCRNFHLNIFPIFKERYIDTGKVKVYLVMYVDNPDSLRATRLVRCLENDSQKIERLIKLIFDKQEEWGRSQDRVKFLVDMFLSFGYGKEAIAKCQDNMQIDAGIMLDQQKAVVQQNINVVPAFVFKNSLHQGYLTCEEIAKKMKLD
jgi:protein-disulfide isomerase